MHLTSSNRISRIRRSGIKRGRWGVFCMPVVPVYYVSHQWARELRRTGQRLMVAVYFWLPDDEKVWAGHYSKQHRLCTATEAAREIMDAADPEGNEVIVQWTVGSDELRKVRAVPQVVG